MSDKQGPTQKNFSSIDPLGEIRRYAEKLWQEAGKPSDKSWQDYWSEAEKTLISGASEVTSPEIPTNQPKARQNLSWKPEVQLSPLFQNAVDQTNNPLLSIIAESLKEPLIEHECLCLGRILFDHHFELERGDSLSAKSLTATADILAELSGEYTDDLFNEDESGMSYLDISLARRRDYWLKKLSQFFARDDALTFSDRNTIARLLHAITNNNQVARAVFDGGRPELA